MDTMITVNDLILAIYFMIPAYIANSIPTVFGGGKSIDFGRKFIDGERIFGTNKTIKGFLSGLICGSLAAIMEDFILIKGFALVGISVSLGSLSGDLFGAFIKRRLKLAPGFPLPLMDQLDFIFGALLFAYPVYNLTLGAVFILILVTPPFHIFTNALAYVLKLKNTFW